MAGLREPTVRLVVLQILLALAEVAVAVVIYHV
jgi:hypothetical protein